MGTHSSVHTLSRHTMCREDVRSGAGAVKDGHDEDIWTMCCLLVAGFVELGRSRRNCGRWSVSADAAASVSTYHLLSGLH